MKVLFVTPWYPTDDRPAYGVYVREFARAVEEFSQIAVLHLDGHRRPPDRKLISFERETDPSITRGIPIFRARWALAPGPLPSLPIRLLAAATAYRKIIRTFEPDILHAHVFSAGLVAAVIGRLTRTPVVITEHKLTDTGSSRRALEARIAYMLAYAVLPVSEFLRHAIQHRGLRGSFIVVPNVVDTSVFRPNETPPQGGRRLLFVGALRGVQGKGLPDLLSACRLLHDRGRPVDLEVLGEGPKRDAVEQLVRDLGLGPWVNLRGAVLHEDVAAAMQANDLLVMPSTSAETFCVPLAEAQACGLPSVATRVGAIPETLDLGAGVLVAPGDPHALADAIDEALRDLSRWDRDRIVASARKYGSAAIGQTLKGIYEEALLASKN